MLSSKDKKQLIILGVLVGVLVLVVIGQIKARRAKMAKYRPKVKTAAEMAKDNAVRKPLALDTEEKEEITTKDYEHWQGSPFSIRRRSGVKGEAGPLKLSGIAIDPDNPKDSYVILNDFILKEGDQLEDTKVLKISEDSVIIERKGRKYKLTMW